MQNNAINITDQSLRIIDMMIRFEKAKMQQILEQKFICLEGYPESNKEGIENASKKYDSEHLESLMKNLALEKAFKAMAAIKSIEESK